MAIVYYDDMQDGVLTNFVDCVRGNDFYEVHNITSNPIFVKVHGATLGYKIRLMPNEYTTRHMGDINNVEVFNINAVAVETISIRIS